MDRFRPARNMISSLSKKWLVIAISLVCAGVIIGITGITLSKEENRTSTDQPSYSGVVGEILRDRPIGQTFVATADGLDGIDVMLATYARRNSCRIVFTLYDLEASRLVSSVTSSCEQIEDNADYTFKFPSVHNSRGRTYWLQIESPDASVGQAITAYAASWDVYPSGSLYLPGGSIPGALVFQSHYRTSLLNWYLGRLSIEKPLGIDSPLLLGAVGIVYFVSHALFVLATAALVRSRAFRKHNLMLAILLLLFLGQTVAWVTVVPRWQVPDEVQNLHDVRRAWVRVALPSRQVTDEAIGGEVLGSMIRHRWLQIMHQPAPPDAVPSWMWLPFLQRGGGFPSEIHPPMYYEMNAWSLILIGAVDVDDQLRIVRILSAAMGVGVVLIAYLAGRVSFSQCQLPGLIIGGVAALIPQRAFMAAGANNDNLAVLAVSIVFLALVSLVTRGANVWRALLLVAGCALTVTSKSTAFAVLPAVAVVLCSSIVALIVRKWSATRVPKSLVKGMVFSVFLLVAVGALFIILDIGSSSRSSANSSIASLKGPIDRFLQQFLLSDLRYLLTVDNFPKYSQNLGRYLSMLIDSFWGRFGWMSLPLPSGWYLVLEALTALSIVGSLWFILRTLRSAGSYSARLPAIIVALSLLVVFTAFGMPLLHSLVEQKISQGRYALPAVVPFAIVFVVGLRSLLPVRFQQWFCVLLIAFMFVLNVQSLVFTIIPASYGW